MIHSRVTAESLVEIPDSVRKTLDIGPGDLVGYEIEAGVVTLKKINANDPFENPFATFTEWGDDIDREAFRDL